MGRQRRTRLSAVVVAACCAALAAGCGASPDNDNTARSGTTDTPGTSSASSAPDTRSDTGSAPATTAGQTPDQKSDQAETKARPKAAKTPWCGTSALSARVRELSPGAGQRYAALVLTNTSSSACRTQGYIGMQLLDRNHDKLSTNVVRDHQKSQPLTLAPRASAWARLHWGAVPGEGDSTKGDCQPTARQVQVTPPDTYAQLVAAWRYGPVCQSGRINVLPLAPGSGPAR